MKKEFGVEEFTFWALKAVVYLVLAGVAFIIAWAIGSGVLYLQERYDEKMRKQECYEIYATDNVILKRCEKYIGGK